MPTNSSASNTSVAINPSGGPQGDFGSHWPSRGDVAGFALIAIAYLIAMWFRGPLPKDKWRDDAP